MAARQRTPADAGVLAAGLLVDACWTDRANSLRLEVVRDLALDLGGRLEDLAGEGLSADSLVEAALACADLATLAACNLPVLPEKNRPLATAAAHLAVGATRALSPLVESESQTLGWPRAENMVRDARSARWRVDVAAKQLDN